MYAYTSFCLQYIIEPYLFSPEFQNDILMAHFSGPGRHNMGFTISPGLLVRCAARCLATDYCQSYSVLPDGSCVLSDACIGGNYWVVRP